MKGFFDKKKTAPKQCSKGKDDPFMIIFHYKPLEDRPEKLIELLPALKEELAQVRKRLEAIGHEHVLWNRKVRLSAAVSLAEDKIRQSQATKYRRRK